jgi:hypothetical protein
MKKYKPVKIAISVIAVLLLFFLFYKAYDVIYSYFGDIGEAGDDFSFGDADKFIKYGYPEIKSLSTQMITLLTSVLVFSITFSEKIVNFGTAEPYKKQILLLSWTFLILAIVCDGIGLAVNSFALPFALSDVHTIEQEKRNSIQFYGPAARSLSFIIFSGLFFILGLISLIASGISSMARKQPS